MTTATINLNTVELTDDEAFAAYEAEFHFSMDHDFDNLPEAMEPDGPTEEQWHRDMLMAERDRDWLEEQREMQIARNEAIFDYDSEMPF